MAFGTAKRIPRRWMRSTGLWVALAGLLAACGSASSSGPPSSATTAAPPSAASPTTAAPPTTSGPHCAQAADLARWNTSRLAAQMVATSALLSAPAGAEAQVAAGAGGVVLMGSSTSADLGAQLHALASANPDGVAPLLMTDEEGGSVQRLVTQVGDLPSAREMAATMTSAQVQALAATVGAKMAALSIRADLAPVLDLDAGPGPSATNPDGTRSFSLDPAIAGEYGSAFARGLESAGVIPVAKHFPGLGEASGNTDVAPAHTLPFASLQQAGLLPFERLIREGVPAIMVSNATVPGLSDTVPASLSGHVISGLLRAQLGFGGVVMTDSLEAGAITAYQPDLGKAAVQSLQAGSDMVMLAGTGPGQARTFDQVVQAITSAINSDALPRIFAEYSVRRILEMKGVPSACVSL